MPHIPFDILESFISHERLGTYVRMASGSKEKAADLYIENLNQCQILHTRLHWLEIGLRNAMNKQLSFKYGKDWYDNAGMGLEAIEQQQIRKAKDTISKNHKRISNPDMVSALTFGLWVNLYNKPYEELWRKCLAKAFPHRPAILTRKHMRETLHPILRLRNRIAHYEPILSLDLPRMQQNIVDIVRWIEPNIHQ
jgi:Abi-like protein